MSIRIRIQALIAEVAVCVEEAGATMEHTSVWNVFLLNASTTVKVTLASNRSFLDGTHRWRVPLECGAPARFVLCGLLDEKNDQVECFLLLQPQTINKASLLLSKTKLQRYANNQFTTIREVFGLPGD